MSFCNSVHSIVRPNGHSPHALSVQVVRSGASCGGHVQRAECYIITKNDFDVHAHLYVIVIASALTMPSGARTYFARTETQVVA